MPFDAGDRDPFDDWRFAVGPWRPRPLSRPDPPMPVAQRIALLLAIAVLHALLLWFAATDDGRALVDTTGETTTLVFVAPEPPPPRVAPAPIPAPAKPVTAAPSAPVVARPTPAPAVARPVDLRERAPPVVDDAPPPPGAMVAVEPTPRTPEPLVLYDADGSLALPDDVVERLHEVEADDRAFDFQMPGLVESGRFLDRPPALAYEETRFEQYWQPDKGAVTRILEKAVEATSGTVEIPLPGTRGGKLVCKVSILALGGGCGVDFNGVAVQLDDPATLSPDEAKQCEAWWEQIVAAGDHDTWRYTRDLYEAQCRKPLARVDPADSLPVVPPAAD